MADHCVLIMASETVQRLVRMSREAQWKGQAKHTQNYRAFDEGNVRDGKRRFGPGQMMHVSTWYDTTDYRGMDHPIQLQAGPLVTVFRHYARLFNARKALRQRSPTYQDIHRANSTLVYGELYCFATDFGLCPGIISKGELYYLFRHTQRYWCPEASPSLEPSAKLFYEELMFDEFEECLARIALLAFSRKSSEHVALSPLAKVEKLVELLDLRSVAYVKRRLSLGTQPGESFGSGGDSSGGNGGGGGDSGRGRGSGSPRRPRDPDTDPFQFLRSRDNSVLDYSAKEEVRVRDRSTRLFKAAGGKAVLTAPFASLRRQVADAQWRSFGAPVINMGRVEVGNAYRYQVRVCNKTDLPISLELEVVGLPFVSVSYSIQTLPAGLTRWVEVCAAVEHPGEYRGELQITGRVVLLPGAEEVGEGEAVAAPAAPGGAAATAAAAAAAAAAGPVPEEIEMCRVMVYGDARAPGGEAPAPGLLTSQRHEPGVHRTTAASIARAVPLKSPRPAAVATWPCAPLVRYTHEQVWPMLRCRGDGDDECVCE